MDFPRTSQYSKSPLATKLLRAVLSVYLVVALIVTSLQLVFEFRDERMRLQEEINNSAVAFLPVLELALWNLDFEQLDATFEAIWLNQAIGRVSITDDLGQELVSSARDYTQSVLGSMTLPWYEFGYDIYYSDSRTENQYVGRLNLASNSIVLLQRAMNTFIFTLVNAAIKTLVLWLIFYYAVIKYIAKPLGHLGKEIDAFDPDSPMQGKVDSNLSPNQAKNELTELAATFANLKSTLLEKNNQIQIRQETLEDAVEELTRVSNAKSVFLAHMSHELRTPLNGILGMVEFLNETTLDKKQRSYVETLSDSGKQLLSVINNVLDISKIESGKLQLEAVEFDLKKLIDQSINTFALIAKKKNLEFDCDTKNLLTRKVLGDPVKITQVFNNLLGNAIKFTEEGSVVVIVSSKFSGSDVLFETKISDSGIGISEEQQKKLFKSFSQVDESTTRKFGGTGLGLAISNQLVESMGGRISVSSIEGEGATFEFFLTLKTPSSDAEVGAEDLIHGNKMEEIEASIEDCSFEDLNILVAEDNEINQQVILGLLKKLGVSADIAQNGLEVLSNCEKSPCPYDLVFMDIEMPEMDGWAATTKLREQNAKGKSGEPLRIVGLSAHALDIEREVIESKGMDAYISKPISITDIARVLSRI